VHRIIHVNQLTTMQSQNHIPAGYVSRVIEPRQCLSMIFALVVEMHLYTVHGVVGSGWACGKGAGRKGLGRGRRGGECKRRKGEVGRGEGVEVL
jgi:hypothetical protein